MSAKRQWSVRLVCELAQVLPQSGNTKAELDNRVDCRIHSVAHSNERHREHGALSLVSFTSLGELLRTQVPRQVPTPCG